jgi:CDP-6-deoxy-D-xylo-4-hexulose-3-dehydrase
MEQDLEKTLEKNLRLEVKKTAETYFNAIKSSKGKKTYLPPSGKVLDANDLSAMIDASLDMWLTTGRFNDEFEKKIAQFIGTKYALTVNSGSSANLLAMSALTSHKLKDKKMNKGDEVITVACGFPTTVAPIIQNGFIPVFIDVELGTYNIDASKIEEAITAKTKAIFIAHTLGNTFDLDKVLEICSKYNLWLIEDNCDALGAKYNGKYTGSFGHIATGSFYPAHHITMGEGGIVLTNDSNLYRIMMSIRDWGRDCWCAPGKDDSCGKRFTQQFGNLPLGYDHKYTYSHLGYNLKITDWQASIGLSQLEKLTSYVEKRRQNFDYLKQGLKCLDQYLLLPEPTKNSEPSWFGFVITVKENEKYSTREFIKYLEDNKIGTRPVFAGNMLRQPVFVDNDISLKIGNSEIINSKNLTESDYKKLPNTDIVMNNTFWIGVWPGLEKEELNYMVEKIKKYSL